MVDQVWVLSKVSNTHQVIVEAIHSNLSGILPILAHYSDYFWEKIDNHKFHARTDDNEMILEKWEIEDV